MSNGQNCWFCEKALASEKYAYKKKMAKYIGGRRTHALSKQLYYQNIVLEIPRCETCRKMHRFFRISLFGIGCLASVLFFTLVFLVANEYAKQIDAITFTIAGMIPAGLVALFVYGVARLITRLRFREFLAGEKMKLDFGRVINKHPEVRRYKEQGYFDGHRGS